VLDELEGLIQDAGAMAKSSRSNKRQAAMNSGLVRGSSSSSSSTKKPSAPVVDNDDEDEFEF
jgi:hypothetical protein